MKYIGIDPDLRKSGVCVLDSDGNIELLDSIGITKLIDLIQDNPTALYAIEDVNRNKAIFIKHPNKRVQDNKRVQANIAQKVGMVKGSASLIKELIQSYTGKKAELAPIGIGKQLKRNAELFRRITGYQGRTNEDKRDAYSIARWLYVQNKVKK